MTDETSAYGDALDSALADLYPVGELLAAAADERPPSPHAPRTLGEVGLFAARLPVDRGGLAAGPELVSTLMETAGRRLMPTALRDVTLLLVPVLAHCADRGDDRAAAVLDGVVAGQLGGAVAVSYGGPLVARATNDPQLAAVITTDDCLLVEWDALQVTPRRGIEPGSGTVTMSVPDRAVPAARQCGSELAAELLPIWEIGLVSEALGVADEMVWRSVEHASTREQFGAAIGSFQSVAHLLAEMKVRTEAIRSVQARLVSLLGSGAGDQAEALRTAARHWVPQAVRHVCETAIQVHGGIGFTWELGLHLYYRRALHLQATLGGAHDSAEAGGRFLVQRATGENPRDLAAAGSMR